MLHHYLRFERRVEFKGDRNCDQHTRCAEYGGRGRVNRFEDDSRYERNKRKEYRAEKSNPSLNSLQVIRSRLTGTNTQDKSAVLLDGLGNIVGIELYLRIEEGKEQNEQRQNDHIEP